MSTTRVHPGGATNLGITRRTLASWRKVTPWTVLPKAAIAALTPAEAAEICRGLYWMPVRGLDLPAGLGPGGVRFCRQFRAATRHPGAAASARRRRRWAVRPENPGRNRRSRRHPRRRPAHRHFCDSCPWLAPAARRFSTFGRGWTRCVATIRTAALAMAGTTLHLQPQGKTEMNLDFLSGYRTYIVAARHAGGRPRLRQSAFRYPQFHRPGAGQPGDGGAGLLLPAPGTEDQRQATSRTRIIHVTFSGFSLHIVA